MVSIWVTVILVKLILQAYKQWKKIRFAQIIKMQRNFDIANEAPLNLSLPKCLNIFVFFLVTDERYRKKIYSTMSNTVFIVTVDAYQISINRDTWEKCANFGTFCWKKSRERHFILVEKISCTIILCDVFVMNANLNEFAHSQNEIILI